jgi:hypothetical protein
MKKGMTSFEMVTYIFRIIFLVIVISAILILVRTYIVISVDTFDAESELIYNRFIYSVNGISYYDHEINRLYPGVIDIKRFNSSILDKAVDFGEYPHVGAEFTLKDERGIIKKTAIYNEDFYDEKIKLFDAGYIRGAGGVKALKKENYVVYKDEDGKTKQGFLEVEIVIPNS